MNDTTSAVPVRRDYKSPVLTRLGSLVSLVAGGSGPTLEVNGPGPGCMNFRANPGGLMTLRVC